MSGLTVRDLLHAEFSLQRELQAYESAVPAELEADIFTSHELTERRQRIVDMRARIQRFRAAAEAAR